MRLELLIHYGGTWIDSTELCTGLNDNRNNNEKYLDADLFHIFHLFFSMVSKEYPEKILAMPYGQSMNSLVIMHHLGNRFNQEKWDKLTQQVSFHKLAFRVSKEIKEDKENYFNKIISLYT